MTRHVLDVARCHCRNWSRCRDARTIAQAQAAQLTAQEIRVTMCTRMNALELFGHAVNLTSLQDTTPKLAPSMHGFASKSSFYGSRLLVLAYFT